MSILGSVRDMETAEEFEAQYAAASDVTVAQLHAWGRYAERCDCGERYCTGWAMGHQWEDAIVEDQLRGAAS
jgi:transposase InsO family protein